MENKIRKQLAQKVRLLRFVHGWSQEDLAKKSGLHRTYISTLERAACSVGLDNLERIAQAFGLSVHDLLGMPDTRMLSKLLHSRPHPRR